MYAENTSRSLRFISPELSISSSRYNDVAGPAKYIEANVLSYLANTFLLTTLSTRVVRIDIV